MKFGYFGLHKGPGIEPDMLARRARAAEEAGFESLWVGDHIALPPDMPGATEPRLEALAALIHLAATTSSVRLAAGVLVVPQRHPVLLAKQLTSLDVLSQGRLIVGVGVGHVEAELAALGVRMSERGRRTDEYLVKMVQLWTRPTEVDSAANDNAVVQYPGPIQVPHPPIVVGGHSAAALARATRLATGWFGWLTPIEETRDLIQRLEDLAGSGNRPDALGPLEITVAAPGEVTLDTVAEYQLIGVDRLVVGPDTGEGDEPDRFIENFERSVIAHQPDPDA